MDKNNNNNKIIKYVVIENSVIAVSTTALVLGLYYMSGSMLSLIGLLMLGFMTTETNTKKSKKEN